MMLRVAGIGTPAWSAARMPRMDGRIVVVTGGTRGLGAHVARSVVAAGGRVILTSRSLADAQRVAARLGPRAQGAQLDLADFASVRRFADELSDVDVVIHNAGVLASTRVTTTGGVESGMATNFLGPFLLTNLITHKVRDRIVIVSSLTHRWSALDLDDLSGNRHSFHRLTAYGRTKLAVLLWALELDRRLREQGSPVTVIATHPGWASTDMTAITPFAAIHWLIARFESVLANTSEQGAASTLYAACMPVATGSFVGPVGIGGIRGAPGLVSRSRAASDLDAAGRLWELAESLTSPHTEPIPEA